MWLGRVCDEQYLPSEVQDRTHDGQAVRVVVATKLYATDREDLWNALTDAERLPRWFLPITGQLELGGRHQIEGNAEGRSK